MLLHIYWLAAGGLQRKHPVQLLAIVDLELAAFICARLLQGLQRVISDSVLFIYGYLVRRPVIGYLNRPEMASNRLCNTSIIIVLLRYHADNKRVVIFANATNTPICWLNDD